MGLQDDNRESFDEALAKANEAERKKKAQAKDSAAPVDINDSQALKELATQVLVEIIQKSPRNVSLVAACRELLDRCVGKAPQSITMDIADKRLDKAPIDDLLLLAAMMKEPVIVAPMPTKLIENNE